MKNGPLDDSALGISRGVEKKVNFLKGQFEIYAMT